VSTTNALFFAYLVGLVGGFGFRTSRSVTFRQRQKPVGEKMLRGAGHSLSEEVEKRVEKLLLAFVCLVFLPLFLFLPSSENASPILWFGLNSWIWICLFLVAGFVCSLPLSSMAIKLANYYLGLKGERWVGDMLNWMLKDGFEVFHDFPIEPDGKTGNIDHVIVGPNGVFAIETKTYRKPKDTADGKNYEVKFDGKLLSFPHRTTKKGIGQATHNARLLSKHLSASLDTSIEVFPILALPGWFVESTSRDPLLVLNPKNIRSAVLKKTPTIDDSLKRKISYQLELRCRDVEF